MIGEDAPGSVEKRVGITIEHDPDAIEANLY